jgi:O-antigen ligase
MMRLFWVGGAQNAPATSTHLERWRIALRIVQVACFGVLVVLLMRPLNLPDPFVVGPHLSWTIICLVTALVILIPELLDRGWPATDFDWPIWAYVAILGATSIASVNRSETLVWILAVAGNIALFTAAVVVARNAPWVAQSLLLFLVAIIALLLLMATGYHAQVGLMTRPRDYPVPEAWSGYPELGTLAAIQFSLLIAAVQTARHRAGAMTAGTLVLLTLIELALLYSRGAWLAAGAVAGVTAGLMASRGQLRRALVGAGLMLALAGVLTAANPTLRHLLQGGTSARVDGNYIQIASPGMRVRLWTRTLRMIADHPIAGVGLGNFRQVFETTYNPEVNEDGRRGVHAHNLWLQQYAEIGLIGGTAYLVLWIAVFRRAWKGARAAPCFLSVGLLLALTALAASNLTTNMFSTPGRAAGRLQSLAWLLFALVAATPIPPARQQAGPP